MIYDVRASGLLNTSRTLCSASRFMRSHHFNREEGSPSYFLFYLRGLVEMSAVSEGEQPQNTRMNQFWLGDMPRPGTSWAESEYEVFFSPDCIFDKVASAIALYNLWLLIRITQLEFSSSTS